jgi:DNA modification methylase
MKAGTPFYIFHASITVLEFETALRNNNLKTRQQLIWAKNTIVLGRQDYQWKHEPILYGWKEGAAHYFLDDRTKTTIYEQEKPDLDKLKKEELKTLLEQIYASPNTLIHENKPTRSDEHPTMKPIKLLAHLIRNSSSRNQIVLDQFGGSGSTLITCEQLGRTCYMMELDPKFVDVIITRWEKYTGQKATKIKGE